MPPVFSTDKTANAGVWQLYGTFIVHHDRLLAHLSTGNTGGALLEHRICQAAIPEPRILAPCMEIRIPDSGKYLLEESGSQENFASGIGKPGRWNPEFQKRLESRIQVPLTNTRIQFLESGIQGVESRIQGCLGFPNMGREFTQDRQRWVTFRCHSDFLYRTREHPRRIQF